MKTKILTFLLISIFAFSCSTPTKTLKSHHNCPYDKDNLNKSDISKLSKQLNSNNEHEIAHAAYHFGRNLKKEDLSSPIKDRLTVLLDHSSRNVRVLSSIGLARLCVFSESLIPGLTEGLNDDSPGIRWNSAVGLGAMGPISKPAIPSLIDTLKDPDENIQIEAAYTLGRIGLDARIALPKLKQRYQSTSNKYLKQAIEQSVTMMEMDEKSLNTVD